MKQPIVDRNRPTVILGCFSTLKWATQTTGW